MRFALTSEPPVVPPPPDTVSAIPPFPAFGGTPTFCRGGGEFLNIVEETARARAGGGGPLKRKTSAGPSSPDARHTRKKSAQTYIYVFRHREGQVARLYLRARLSPGGLLVSMHVISCFAVVVCVLDIMHGRSRMIIWHTTPVSLTC